MKTEITEGNWRVGDNGHTIFGPQTDSLSPEIVAIMGTRPTFRGNAALIASAPELLEACKAILSRYESLFSGVETCDIHPIDESIMNTAREAIAKAEGKS